MSQFNAPPSFRYPRPKPAPPARSPTRAQALPRLQTPQSQPQPQSQSQHDRRRQSRTHKQYEDGARDPESENIVAGEEERERRRAEHAVGRAGHDLAHDEQVTRRTCDEEMLDWNLNTASEASQTRARQDVPTSAQPKRRRLDAPPGSGLNENNETGFPRPTSKHFQMSASTGHTRRDIEGGKAAAATPTFNTPRTFRAVMPPPSLTPARPSPAGTTMNASTTPTTNLDTPPQRPRFLPPTSTINSNIDATSTSPSHHTPFLLHPSNPNLPPPATALPDIFSPHKRKQQRYLPGGFADQVRGWLLDVGAGGVDVPRALAGVAVGSTGGRRDGRGAQGEVELEIQDVCTAAAGGGVGSVATGVARSVGAQGNAPVRVVLAGHGGSGSGAGGNDCVMRARSGRDADLRPGRKVVVRMPAWEIEVEVQPDVGPGEGQAGAREREEEEEGEGEKEKQTWVVCPAWRAA